VKATDPQTQPPTPVAEDRHATVQQLHARAAADYANGWGQPDVRAQAGTDNEQGGPR
jgi:hypothetical protein